MTVIGLDISQKSIDCHIRHHSKKGTLKIGNSVEGCLQLRRWIAANRIRKPVIAMEATGIYYERAANYLSAYYRVVVINPLKIKDYGKSVFSRTKTDKADASLIAEYAYRHTDQLQTYYAPTAE